MASPERPAIGHLSEHHPGWRHQLLKGQRTTHQQRRKGEFGDHHSVQHPGENHGQAPEAALKQAQTGQLKRTQTAPLVRSGFNPAC